MRLAAAACSALALAGIALGCIAGLAACASTPQASVERDSEAKQFAHSPAASTLYIYRPDVAQDDTVLWIDDRLIGATLPRTFFRVSVDPGRHVITGMAADNGKIALETRPGEVYFVALTSSAGQSRFQQVAAEHARTVLATCCSLLENWAPGQRPLLR